MAAWVHRENAAARSVQAADTIGNLDVLIPPMRTDTSRSTPGGVKKDPTMDGRRRRRR